MATTPAAAAPLSMKLLVDTKARRVLFAEAGKDVVDFLFSLLTLPVATAVKLVGEESVAGSVGNLYASVERLDDTYVLPGTDKGALLSPTVVSPAASADSSLLLRLPEPSSVKPNTFYRCNGTRHGSCSSYITVVYGRACPACFGSMTAAAQLLPPSAGSDKTAQGAGKGLVQGIVTYTVMDNLTVTPMSAISSITLLNTFAVRDLADLQEKIVQLGYDEGREILKASLQSKTVLTDVFLGNKANGDA